VQLTNVILLCTEFVVLCPFRLVSISAVVSCDSWISSWQL